jgi:lysophospholipase L1-like esterase
MDTTIPAGRRALRAFGAITVAVAMFAVAACGSSSAGTSAKPSASATPSATTAAGVAPSSPGQGKLFYVSIGDSYAAGYQPVGNGSGPGSYGHGYANQLPALVDSHDYHLTLVNFGCSGATTTTLIAAKGCKYAGHQGPNEVVYPNQTQAAAASAFIAAHRAQVGLVTVSISGNDITACGRQKDTSAASVAACLTAALAKVKANMTTFLAQLRTASGPDIPIVGITYPDVILGSYVSTNPSAKALAPISVTAFKSLINPTLKAQYTAVKGIFVDITAATGAYIPFSQTTTLAPYGTIPVSVANVCKLTYYCQLTNIHPRTVGYTLIAQQIAKALPPR